jgi:hypothetical protein
MMREAIRLAIKVSLKRTMVILDLGGKKAKDAEALGFF